MRRRKFSRAFKLEAVNLARERGRPRCWSMREIFNAVFYVLGGGIVGRLPPSDFPPWPTVYRWFAALRDGPVFERIDGALVMADHQRIGRDASPAAAIIDSQSIKTTESGGPRGCDDGKKFNGRKRHALVDTDGRALLVEAHPADIQDRDSGGPPLQISRPMFPFIEIVRKQHEPVGFVGLTHRWVVECLFAWINRNKRLAKDFEATISSTTAFFHAASALLLKRRLARAS